MILCTGSVGPQAGLRTQGVPTAQKKEGLSLLETHCFKNGQLLADTCRQPPALQWQFDVFVMVSSKLLVNQDEQYIKRYPINLVMS